MDKENIFVGGWRKKSKPQLNFEAIIELLSRLQEENKKLRERNDELEKVIEDGKQIVPKFEYKDRRKKLGITLREVENATGISNAYLSQLENDKIKKPSYDTIKKLDNFYKRLEDYEQPH